MNEDEILSADDLLPMRQYLSFVSARVGAGEVQPNSPFDMIDRLVRSHEALRARCEAERQARLDAERELGERMDAAAVHYGGAIRAVEAERDALAAALTEYGHHNGSCRYSGMHWTPGMEGGRCTCGLDVALLPSPASQEAVSDAE